MKNMPKLTTFWQNCFLLINKLLFLPLLFYCFIYCCFLIIDQKIQWEYVQGLFETAVYGGRIDVSFDSRVLSSYLREYFDNKVVSGGGRKLLGGKLSVPTSVDYKVSKEYFNWKFNTKINFLQWQNKTS